MNWGKQCVLRNLPALNLTLWKTRENAGFQSLTPDESEVLHPENIRERKPNNTFAKYLPTGKFKLMEIYRIMERIL